MEDLVLDGAMPVNDMELEERGGLQKLKNADPKKEASERARAEYRIWFQAPCWFDEEIEGGTAGHVPGDGYASVAQEVASYKGKLRGVYEDSSDFDRIKIRAENLYLQGDYEGCARCWLRLFGTYSIGGRSVGGIPLEMQDSISRCLMHLGRAESTDAQALMADMAQTSRSKPLCFALLKAKLLRSAAEKHEALEAFCESSRMHPVDPMSWVNLSEAYRASWSQGEGRTPVLARRCMRLATKMMQYGSNATHCHLTMRHFGQTAEVIARLCNEHPEFYLGAEQQLPSDEVTAYFQVYKPSEIELAMISHGATPFEVEWLCEDGAEIATMMLDRVKEDNIREATG